MRFAPNRKNGPTDEPADFSPRRDPDLRNLPERVQPTPTEHDIGMEEAANAARRYTKMAMEIEQLKHQRDEWRRHAEAADAEIARLEHLEVQLRELLERRTAELERDRDMHRDRLVHLVAQFESAGAIILKCLSSAQAQAPEVNLRELSAKLHESEDDSYERHTDHEQEAERLPEQA